jgi:predicted nucleic acid-binding protein
MGIVEDIGSGPVCLDTCIFIYFIEENHEFLEIVLPIFKAIDQGLLTAITSGITLFETLVVPFRKGDSELAGQYERILTCSPGIKMYELNREILKLGAYLRANLGIKTPDALQLAAAKKGGCSTFVTNDRRLPTIEGLTIFQLSAYTNLK